MNEDIFISYRREDASFRARLLKLYLEKCNYSVFMDQDRIDSTRPFPDVLQERIAGCKDYVLVLSSAGVSLRTGETDNLFEEICFAYSLYKNGLIALHTVAPSTFDMRAFSKMKYPERYAEAMSFFQRLTPLSILDFEGKDAAICALIKEATTSFQSNARIIGVERGSDGGQSGGYMGEITTEQEERLVRKGTRAYLRDKPTMQYIEKRLRAGTDAKLKVLDVGCGNGAVTHLFFGDDEAYGTVIGVDRNKNSIDKAKRARYPKRFVFAAMDVTADDFDDKLTTLCHQNGIESFDIVFLSHVLQHLPRRTDILQKLAAHLRNGGCVIVLNSDDGTKTIYKHNGVEVNTNLVGEIVELTQWLPHMADLFYGRKVYHDMVEAGLQEVRVIPSTSATSMFDEETRKELRKELFRDHFAWRLKEFQPDESASDTENAELLRKKTELEQKLKVMEDVLVWQDSWYSYTEFFGYGFYQKR